MPALIKLTRNAQCAECGAFLSEGTEVKIYGKKVYGIYCHPAPSKEEKARRWQESKDRSRKFLEAHNARVFKDKIHRKGILLLDLIDILVAVKNGKHLEDTEARDLQQAEAIVKEGGKAMNYAWKQLTECVKEDDGKSLPEHWFITVPKKEVEEDSEEST